MSNIKIRREKLIDGKGREVIRDHFEIGLGVVYREGRAPAENIKAGIVDEDFKKQHPAEWAAHLASLEPKEKSDEAA